MQLDRALIRVAAVVVLGAIMSILDTTIVNVAVDELSRRLDSPLETVQWVTTGYLLALAVVTPLTGWAADRFGTKRLFMGSMALFLAGSALSGTAWSIGSLIAFRVLQGLGGGMILPVGMTILAHAAGPQRVGRVMSIVGVPMLLGPILGPVLGGWLIDSFSWRWIFFVNLPVGVLALVAASRVLDADRPQPAERLDWTGLGLLSPGLASLVYGLAERSAPPALAGLALITVFVARSAGRRGALLDVDLFRIRAVGAAGGTIVLFSAALLAAMFLLPLYLQAGRGESAFTTGLLLIPQGAGAALMMPFAGRATDRTGARSVVLGGTVTTMLALLALTQVGGNTSYRLFGGVLFVLGLGMGSTMMPAMAAAYQALDRPQVARATSALTILRYTGGSAGTALVAVVLGSRLEDGAADAFGRTFWIPFLLAALALVPAALLPRSRPLHGAPAGKP